MDGRRITIDGKRWQLVYATLRGKDGDCDPPNTTSKTIRLARYLKRYPVVLAETIIHEVLHARLPELTEDTVNTLAADMTRILDKEGCLTHGKES